MGRTGIVGAVTLALAAGHAQASDVPPEPADAGANLLSWTLLLAAPLVLVLLWIRDVIRPGSPARHGVRDTGPLPWWFWLVAGLCVFLTTGLVAVATRVALSGEAGTHPADAISSMHRAWSALAGFGAAAGLGWVLARRARTLAPRAGLQITWGGLLTGAWCLILAAPVVHAAGWLAARIYHLSTGLEPQRLAHDTLREIVRHAGEPPAWVFIAAVVVAAPIAEEIIFRAFLQTALLRLTRRAWPAIVITSAIFTLVHGVEPYAMATIFTLSLCLGLAFEHRRNLGVPIAMHALFNAANVALGVWG